MVSSKPHQPLIKCSMLSGRSFYQDIYYCKRKQTSQTAIGNCPIMFRCLITRSKIVMPESIQSKTWPLFLIKQNYMNQMLLIKSRKWMMVIASGAVSITNAAQLRDETPAQGVLNEIRTNRSRYEETVKHRKPSSIQETQREERKYLLHESWESILLYEFCCMNSVHMFCCMNLVRAFYCMNSSHTVIK